MGSFRRRAGQELARTADRNRANWRPRTPVSSGGPRRSARCVGAGAPGSRRCGGADRAEAGRASEFALHRCGWDSQLAAGGGRESAYLRCTGRDPPGRVCASPSGYLRPTSDCAAPNRTPNPCRSLGVATEAGAGSGGTTTEPRAGSICQMKRCLSLPRADPGSIDPEFTGIQVHTTWCAYGGSAAPLDLNLP